VRGKPKKIQAKGEVEGMGKGKKKWIKELETIKSIEGSELLKIALAFGWRIERIKGSHYYLKHEIIKNPTFLTIVVTKNYSKRLMRSIIKDIKGDRYFN
jgi:predicted RNA binding protein YcfA (HicA-like mRNA interferase family)